MMPLPKKLQASAQFIDRDFNPKQTKNNRLSIQLRRDGFSFAQIDSFNTKLVWLQDYDVPPLLGDEAVYQCEKISLRFEQVLVEQNLVLKDYKEVIISLESSFFTLVPEALFENEKNRDYLEHLHQLPENILIKTDNLPPLDAVNVFAIYAPLYYSLVDNFPNFKLKHSLSVMLHHALLVQQQIKGKSVFIHIAKQQFFALAFADKQLLFSNTFNFKTKEDFIYFIVLIYQQLEFDLDRIPLYFSGNINRSSSLYHIAYQYIKFLKFYPENSIEWQLGKDIPKEVNTQFQLLIQAILCE